MTRKRNILEFIGVLRCGFFAIVLSAGFFVIVFFVSCNHAKNSSQLHADQLCWLEKFFQDFLFEEGAVFTLLGSKPVTEVPLYHFSQEEFEEIVNNLHQEESKNYYINDAYDLPENWEKWKAIQHKYAIKKYILFDAPHPYDAKISFIYFVDILKTACVLQDHYELFQREFGEDFHPIDVVFEMPNPDSSFWNRIKKSKKAPLFWGLLFGYGKENAYSYQWKYFDQSKTALNFFKDYAIKTSSPDPKGHAKLSQCHFNIPGFISFEKDDYTVKKYEKERAKIKEIYQKENLTTFTLNMLTQ